MIKETGLQNAPIDLVNIDEFLQVTVDGCRYVLCSDFKQTETDVSFKGFPLDRYELQKKGYIKERYGKKCLYFTDSEAYIELRTKEIHCPTNCNTNRLQPFLLPT